MFEDFRSEQMCVDTQIRPRRGQMHTPRYRQIRTDGARYAQMRAGMPRCVQIHTAKYVQTRPETTKVEKHPHAHRNAEIGRYMRIRTDTHTDTARSKKMDYIAGTSGCKFAASTSKSKKIKQQYNTINENVLTTP